MTLSIWILVAFLAAIVVAVFFIRGKDDDDDDEFDTYYRDHELP